MKTNIDDFEWHSAIGVESLAGNRSNVVRTLPNTASVRSGFSSASAGNFLIHKASQALWRVSDDGGFIEPVFESDVLTEDEVDAGK